MNPDLIKKLDKTKLYNWEEIMDISASIATWTVVELIHNKEFRDKIIMDLFVGKSVVEPNSRHRKKQSKST